MSIRACDQCSIRTSVLRRAPPPCPITSIQIMNVTLEYPLTRTFRWRWFTPAALLGAFVVLIFLTLINSRSNHLCLPRIKATNEPFPVVPLTGYEIVTLFKDDYNVAETHWFYSFMPFRRHSGPICDAHLFKLGDSFTTNYTFFYWSIESIIKPNAGKSGVFYTGTPLTSCDVSSIYINGDLHTWNVDFTVVISCKTDDNFPITARTSFSKSFLPGLYQPLLATVRLDNEGIPDFRGVVLDTMCAIQFSYYTYISVPDLIFIVFLGLR